MNWKIVLLRWQCYPSYSTHLVPSSRSQPTSWQKLKCWSWTVAMSVCQSPGGSGELVEVHRRSDGMSGPWSPVGHYGHCYWLRHPSGKPSQAVIKSSFCMPLCLVLGWVWVGQWTDVEWIEFSFSVVGSEHPQFISVPVGMYLCHITDLLKHFLK